MPYVPTPEELNAIPSAPTAAPPRLPVPAQPAPAPSAASGNAPYIPSAAEMNAIPTAANNGQDSIGRAAQGLVGQDGGRLGCATTACRALSAAGIPFPMTPNARDMESQMAAHGFVKVDPSQSDVLFGTGTGPSGRHVMLNAGNGRTIEDPGGSRGTQVQFGSIPFHDPGLTGYKYVGAGGQSLPVGHLAAMAMPAYNSPDHNQPSVNQPAPISSSNEQTYLHNANNEQRFLHNFNQQRQSSPAGNGDPLGDPVLPAGGLGQMVNIAPGVTVVSSGAAFLPKGTPPRLPGALVPDGLQPGQQMTPAQQHALLRIQQINKLGNDAQMEMFGQSAQGITPGGGLFGAYEAAKASLPASAINGNARLVNGRWMFDPAAPAPTPAQQHALLRIQQINKLGNDAQMEMFGQSAQGITPGGGLFGAYEAAKASLPASAINGNARLVNGRWTFDPAAPARNNSLGNGDPYGDPVLTPTPAQRALLAAHTPLTPNDFSVALSHSKAAMGPNAVALSHAPASPQEGFLARTFGVGGPGGHEGSLMQDAQGLVTGIPSLLKTAGTAYLQGAAAQGLGNAAIGQSAAKAIGRPDIAGSQDFAQAADTQMRQAGQTADPLIMGMTGTARDVLSGHAAQVPGNYLNELQNHPLNFALNTAALLGGAGGALGKAGELADAAGAARLGAGLSKAGEVSHYIAGGGPVGQMVNKGVNAAAGAIVNRLPLGRVPAAKAPAANSIDFQDVSPDAPKPSYSMRPVKQPAAPQSSAPVDLHPTEPVGPNNTARAADGTFVSPAEVNPVPAVNPSPVVHPDVLAELDAEEAQIAARHQGVSAPPSSVPAGPPEPIPAPSVSSVPSVPAPGVRTVPGIDAPNVKSLPLGRVPNAPEFTPPKEKVAETPAAPSVRPTEGVSAPADSSAPVPTQDARLVPNFPVNQLHLDPDRFQYKIGYGKGGSSGSLTDAQAFNKDFAGVVHAWRDPADGKAYVVNGHNRTGLAQRTGTPGIDVRFLDAKTAADARTQGALINIAEGQGSALDAAKLFRETGYTQADIQGMGINLKGQKATQGLALANLNDGLFSQAMRGEMPVERAATIGSILPDHGDQATLLKQVGDRNVTNDDLSEMAQAIKSGPRESRETASLFGTDEVSQSLAIERAQAASYIKAQLAKEGGAFGNAAKNADRLERGNNKIDAKTSADIAVQSRQGAEVFDAEKNAAGPVSDILNAAAKRLARAKDTGETPDAIKQDALRQFQQHAEQVISSGKSAAGQSAGPDLFNAPDARADTDPGAGRSVSTGAGGRAAGEPAEVTLPPAQAAPSTEAGGFSLPARLEQTAQAAADRITARNKGRALSGVDPADLADMTIYGAAKLAKGIVNTADWGNEMVKTFGEAVRPHLNALYAAAKDHLDIRNKAAYAGENIGAARQAHLDSLDAGKVLGTQAEADKAPQAAQETPRQAVGTPQATVQPKASTPKYAGNLNLNRLNASPETIQAMAKAAENAPKNAPIRRGEMGVHVQGLNLRVSDLENIVPGSIPGWASGSMAEMRAFPQAVRALNVKAGTRAADAEREYQASRTPENKQAMLVAGRDLATTAEHDAAHKFRAGGTMSDMNSDASAFEGAIETARERANALNTAPALTAAKPAMKVKTLTYGSRNKVVTTEAYQQALKDLQKAGSTVNSGINPALFQQAVTIGAYHLEALPRQFPAWAAQMRQHFPNADDGELQRVYANAKASLTQGQSAQKQAATAAQRAAVDPVFADALAPKMTRQGAANFTNTLPPDLLNKLLTDAPMSQEEARTLARVHNENLKPGIQKASPNEAAKSLSQIVRDAKAGKLGYDNAKTAVRENLLKSVQARATAEKMSPAEKQAAVDGVTTALSGVGDQDFAGLNAVLRQHNKMTVGASLVGLWRAGLISSPRTIAKIAGEQVGLGVLEEAKRAPAALADRALSAAFKTPRTTGGIDPKSIGQGLNIVKKTGVADSVAIMKHGELSQIGTRSGSTSKQADLPGEYSAGFKSEAANRAANAYVNTITRSHTLVYENTKKYAFDRSLSEQSVIQAMNEAAAGNLHPSQISARAQQIKAAPTREMTAAANHEAQSAALLNDNQLAGAVGSFKSALSPGAKPLADVAVPFSKVPSNQMARRLEYVPVGGIPAALHGTLKMARNPELRTAEQQRAVAQSFGRGTVGAVIGTGGYLGAKAVQNYLAANPYSPLVQTPAGAAAVIPSVVQQYIHGNAKEKRDAIETLTDATFGNSPLTPATADMGKTLAQPNGLNRFAGQQAGTLIPQVVADAAKYTDFKPGQGFIQRQVNNKTLIGDVGSTLQSRLPGLREAMPQRNGTLPGSSGRKKASASPFGGSPRTRSGKSPF